MKRYGRALAGGCLAVMAPGCFAFAAQGQAPKPIRRASITMDRAVCRGAVPTGRSWRPFRHRTYWRRRTLGQSIIIENVVGAGGTTATTRAWPAPANDGLYAHHRAIWARIAASGAALSEALPITPGKGTLSPVALLAGTPILILARKRISAKGPQGIHSPM